MSDFPYFPLYPTDLLGDDKVIVQDLTEFGAYMRLLCLAWQRNPPATIPADDAVIAKMLGVTPEVWSGLRPAVISCWQLRGGMYENKRLRSVYDEMIDRRHKRQQAGRLGGKQCLSNAKALLKQTGDGNGDGTKVVPEGESEGEVTLPPPRPRPPVDDPEPAATVSANATKWAIQACKCYSRHGDIPPTSTEYQRTLANCVELIAHGKPVEKWELLCDWVENSRSTYRPKNPTSMTDPQNWTKWQQSIEDELQKLDAQKKGRR